jgi:hypothetical protein
MKITLDLPDALVREIKDHALNEGLKLQDAIAALLELGLKARRSTNNAPANRVSLPLLVCKQRAEITPEKLSDLLIAQDAQWHGPMGRDFQPSVFL